jgi:hypothetical protein
LSPVFLRVEYHPTSRSTAEQRLWAALLDDALKICGGRKPASNDERKKAIAWIALWSDDVAGFDWCCRALGIDPSAAHACIGEQRLKASREIPRGQDDL